MTTAITGCIELEQFTLRLTTTAPKQSAVFSTGPDRQWNIQSTRNSSVDEIDERYRLNHAIVVKLYHSCHAQFRRNVRLSDRRIATSSAHRYSLVIAPYLPYLLIDQLLVDNWNNLQTTSWENFYYKA